MLREGDIIKLELGHHVYADVPHHFLFDNKKGDWALHHGEVCIVDEFRYMVGEYVVCRTTLDGGGAQLNCSGGHDIYPNQPHVWCENLKTGLRVDFYEEGSFTAVNENIVPIGRAKTKYIKEND